MTTKRFACFPTAWTKLSSPWCLLSTAIAARRTMARPSWIAARECTSRSTDRVRAAMTQDMQDDINTAVVFPIAALYCSDDDSVLLQRVSPPSLLSPKETAKRRKRRRKKRRRRSPSPWSIWSTATSSLGSSRQRPASLSSLRLSGAQPMRGSRGSRWSPSMPRTGATSSTRYVSICCLCRRRPTSLQQLLRDTCLEHF